MSLLPTILNNDIKKPTALVHFERDLSLIEQKLMTLIIFHCQVSEKNAKGFYFVKKSLLREFIGWEDSNNYPRIYEAFESIYNNSIMWNFLGADRTFKSLKCRLIVSLLEPGETGQYIGFQLHQDLEPLIRNPKVFAKLKLIMMVLLVKPKYCYPLYELLADSYSRGQRTVKIPLQGLKDYLGIKDSSYAVFKDFKTRVLKPGIEEINTFSDYAVAYKTYREGKRVGGIIFHIQKQCWQPPLMCGPLKELQIYYSSSLDTLGPQGELLPEEQAFVASIKQYHITESDARLAIEIHGLEGAIEIRDYVLKEVEYRQGKKNQVRDIGAYMIRCFREGFGRKTLEEQEGEARRKAFQEIKLKQEEARERIRNEVEQARKDFWNYQTGLINELIAKMSAEEKAALEGRFIRSNPMWAKKFQETGLSTPLVRSAFYSFAAQELLAGEQRDIGVFARNRGASIEAINLLEGFSV